MSRYSHLPIFQKGYDLHLEIYRTTHNFPREYKYTLGQNMKKTAGEILEYIIIANAKEDKRPYFSKIKIMIERLRISLRTTYDLKIIRSQRLEYLNRLLEDISKQVSGWESWFFNNKKET
jgi:hypothetical protein